MALLLRKKAILNVKCWEAPLGLWTIVYHSEHVFCLRSL